MRRIVAISDFCDHPPLGPSRWGPSDFARAWAGGREEPAVPREVVRVTGGYLERLPLAAVAHGLADQAEIWTWAGRDEGADACDALDGGAAPAGQPDPKRPGLVRRRFRADPHPAPYGSADVLAHLQRTGPPEILCVWGLGVTHAILDACRGAVTIYNSIDAPALRIPPDLARRFDIIIAGGAAQVPAIRAACPDTLVPIMPIGPEFASDETFYPTGVAREFDVAYVAAAQPYKRHHVLLDALAARPATRALCVVGYGEDVDSLRGHAARRGLDVTWVGPPGVPHDEVNRLINRARIGVVCGRDDGAPAILTEYMLAGLPVLANDALVCGLQYVGPKTGLAVPEDRFAEGIDALLARASSLDPRAVVQARWTWPHSVAALADLVADARLRGAARAGRGTGSPTGSARRQATARLACDLER